MQTVADRIKLVKAHFDWNDAELGRQCNVKRATVGKWVAGTSTPQTKNLLPLRRKYRVDENWILYGHGAMIIQTDPAFVLKVRQAEPYLDDGQKEAVLNVVLSFARANGAPPEE